MNFLNHVLKNILCIVAGRKMIIPSCVDGVEGKRVNVMTMHYYLMDRGLVLNPHYQMVTDQQE